MRETAASTASAHVVRTFGVLVLVVAGTMGCGDGGSGGDARAFAVGEGAFLPHGYERAFTLTGGHEAMGRPVTAVEAWGGGCRQLFEGGRSGTAALLQWPCAENEQVFAVADDFWARYREAGDEAATRYGFPVGPRGEWAGGSTQGFGRRGGVEHFFMQRPGQPLHVLSSPILEHYLSFDDRDRRFGYPTSSAAGAGDGRWCQQFEHAAVAAEGGEPRAGYEVTAASPSDRTSTCR